jgi:hypothetical protein
VKVSADEKKWRAEDDMRTLKRAEEIRKDLKRMSAAQECAKKEIETAKTIARMKVKK